MAQPNKLRVTRNSAGVTEVLVSDTNGVVYDISNTFREISGTTTPSGFQNILKAQHDGTVIDVAFTAVDKELNYTLTPAACKQICALAGL